MKYTLAEDARPQAKLLLVATVISIVLWFVPYAEYLVYPFRLFVTLIHESGHALVAFITGGSVQSLTIAADGSGLVYSSSGSLLGQIFASSAGYVGTMLFGVFLLYLIRKNVSPNRILFGSGVFILVITVAFGVLSPVFNFLSLQVGFGSVAFTVFVAALITAALFALSKFANERTARWITGFLAVQCLLNAISDLKTVLFINAPVVGADMQNDASNMANATGIPAFLWVIVWIVISLGLLFIGFRMFASVRNASRSDSVFDDIS
ncbi:MAG: M50 family metallopeptidase [Pyrinomonadaceae bacterium]